MNYTREKTVVTVFGVFLSIIATCCLIVFLPLMACRYTIFNWDFLIQQFTSDDVTSALSELIYEETELEFLDGVKDTPEAQENARIILKELVDLLTTCMFESFESGRNEFDEERLDEFLDGKFTSFMIQYSETPPENINEIKQTLKDDLVKSFNDIDQDLEETSVRNDLKEIISVISVILMFLGVCTGICFLIMIIMYHKKFRALRNVGICLTVSGACSCIFSLFIASFFAAAIKESVVNDEPLMETYPQLYDTLEKVINNFTYPGVGICAVALLVGIIFIIIAVIIGKAYKNSCASSEDYYYNVNNINNNNSAYF